MCIQGVREVEKIQDIVDRVIRRVRPQRMLQPGHPDYRHEPYPPSYRVHMVVLTACIGKRVSVQGGNIMVQTMRSALAQYGGNLVRSTRRDDVCNNESFQLVGWPAVWSCCRDIQARTRRTAHSGDYPCLAHPAEYPTLRDDSDPCTPSWNNTVTVYSKGAMIIRLWWDRPIEWNEEARTQCIDACNAICMLVANCC